MSKEPTKAELRGAIALLINCLSLEIGDTFAVFHDETSHDVLELIRVASAKLGMQMIVREAPTTFQAAFTREADLSFEDHAALSDAIAVITCLTDDSACLEYRGALLRTAVSADKRLAHMPGVRSEFFADGINVDYLPLQQRCDDLALAMALGRTAVLQTYVLDETGSPTEEHRLTFSLGGVDRLPIVSTGLIARGTWGNVPGAETFIAPIEGTAEGTYVLNGSFKNHVMVGGAHLILTFRGGNLTNYNGTEDVLLSFSRLMTTLSRVTRNPQFGLAEFGIGVNTSIRGLVGKPLVDEKCIRTAHIAIGGNAGYGGHLSDSVHEDFVTRNPTVTIDRNLILHRGNDAYVQENWRETVADVDPTPITLIKTSCARRTFIGAEVSADFIRVHRLLGADRLCSYTIGEPATSKLLARLYVHVPHLPGSITLNNLIAQSGMTGELIAVLLTILMKHRLIDVTSL